MKTFAVAAGYHAVVCDAFIILLDKVFVYKKCVGHEQCKHVCKSIFNWTIGVNG